MPHLQAMTTLWDDFPVGMTLVDERGKILVSNKASEIILRLRRDDLPDRSAVDESWGVCGPDGELLPVEEIPTLKALRERRRIVASQVGLKDARGQITWLQLTADPLPTGGALVVYQDITHWCELSASHLRVKNLLRMALELGRLGCFVHQPGRAGWLEDATLLHLLGPDEANLERFREAVEQAGNAPSFAFDFRAIGQGPEPDRWFTCRGETVDQPTGGPAVRLGILQDITLQRREFAAGRVRAITQAKGRMAGYLAHEVNNPLAGLKNAALLIRRSMDDPAKAERYLDLMDQGIARIQEVIRTLTELNRELPEQDGVPLEEIVSELVSLVTRTLKVGQVEILRDLDPSLRLPGPEAEVVRQVLFNLLVNGLEATPQGGTLTLRGSSAQGNLDLEVTDSGAGVPEHLRGAIWAFGFSTKRATVAGGLAPGLALGRSLLRDLGGDLVLLPQAPGRGATFSIRLPLPPIPTV